MALRLAPWVVLERLRSTYWFVPALVTLGAVLLAFGLTALDRFQPHIPSWLGFLVFGGGPDGARALLSAVAGSTITVVSVTFSVLVVALTVSSQHFGPRLLNSFMRDNTSQMVLGTFTGTFAYCLLVLRTVQGDGGDRYSLFVPHFAVTGAVVLTLLTVAMLIYYVHHVARSMQVSEIAARITSELDDAIDRLYPERFGDDPPPRPAAAVPDVPGGSQLVVSPSSGYVQEINRDAVLALAVEHDTTIWLTSRPGDFVVEGAPLAAAAPPPARAGGFGASLAKSYTIANERTSMQDVGFAIQQLVEVALRALSPGVNEPFTAVTCIDRLGQGFTRLAQRRIPAPVRLVEGRVRVVAVPRSFDELLGAALEPIAVHADRNLSVMGRLFETLFVLASVARRREDRAEIRRIADRIWSIVSERLDDSRERSRFAAMRDAVRDMLDARASATDVTLNHAS